MNRRGYKIMLYVAKWEEKKLFLAKEKEEKIMLSEVDIVIINTIWKRQTSLR